MSDCVAQLCASAVPAVLHNPNTMIKPVQENEFVVSSGPIHLLLLFETSLL